MFGLKKTWRNIIIISLIFVIIEAVVAYVVINPFYKAQKVYNSIEDGNWIKTQECYEDLSDYQKDRVQSYLPDYANWVANEYALGNIEYDYTAAVFDAINSIDETDSLYDMYMYDISRNEYVKVLMGIHDAEQSFDNAGVYAKRTTLNAVIQRLDNVSREELLVCMLNEEYRKFLNEEISVESMKSFVALAETNSIYSAYGYSFIVGHNVDCVVEYRAIYENARVKYDEEEYLTVLDMCKDLKASPDDTLYTEKIATLYEDAYNTGKEYYQEILDGYVIKQDADSATALMEELALRYGDDFDVSQVKEDLADDWQLAVMDYVKEWDTYLKRDLATTSTGQYILENKYDSLAPDTLLLQDINGDLVPEMFLYKRSHAEAEHTYIGCYMYAYVDGEYEFLNYINIMNFCKGSYLVAFPNPFGRTTGEECMLVSFDGSSLSYVNECQHIGDEYFVNGESCTDVEYLTAQTEILSYVSEKTVANGDYTSLDDSDTYILSY